ncbi:C2 and GRAM domain-containing protein At1g03370 [Linum perenne]
MRLVVRVIQGRNLPAMDPNGLSDPYVKLQLGKQRFKTKVVKKNLNPTWGEEFSFKVEDLKEELVISVLDEDKYFNDDFVGQLKVPVSRVFDADNKSLGTSWYSLQPKTKKSKNKECGEILLTILFSQNNAFLEMDEEHDLLSKIKKNGEVGTESPSRSVSGGSNISISSSTLQEVTSSKEEKLHPSRTFAERIAQMFNKNSDTVSTGARKSTDVSESEEAPEVSDDTVEDEPSSGCFSELMKEMESRDARDEVPSNLPGGILVDKVYGITPEELNSVLFSPDSSFPKSVAEAQGNTEQQFGTWRFDDGGDSLKRVVTYIKAPSKLIKAVKATEEQTYLKADGKFFAVLISVSTPDVPYGSCFRVELLFCIMPGPEATSGEQTSQLTISWRMNFSQSTMMKGMIENGARQGLKESFEQFASVLSQHVKPVDLKDMVSNKEQVLASLQTESQSDWKLALQYFGNFTVVSTVFIGIYVLIHIWLAMPSSMQGLEFIGLDLPDSIGEVIVCGVLVLQCERVLEFLSRFMQARAQKGSDHGVKAQGDGWLLTVALMDGSNLPTVDSSGFCDPSDISDLADVWVPLKGKLAQACQAKLHLRIFLNNTKGNNVVKEYLSKMEKEVGTKINVRSPQTNSAFQKLFGLPLEEFLINDFTCHLRRKMPLQGRLFLSARIIGFHSNLFGHKTKFFFLWEDIEDIQVSAPTLASMGSPIVVITLRRGRGMDARHGAKSTDAEGRLRFQFHSFVSFNVAHRTIMALWKARSLSPEQKVRIVEEESETKILQSEESGAYLGIEDVSMSEVYSSSFFVPTNFLMELFGGGDLERKIMEKAGSLSYSYTPWESEKANVYQRQIYFRFDKSISRYRGEVTSTQQKYLVGDRKGWVVEEVMTLHGVPLGDYFNLHLKYQIEDSPVSPKSCNVQVSCGIEWLKSTKHPKRMTKNIYSNLEDRLKVMFSVLEKEYTNCV